MLPATKAKLVGTRNQHFQNGITRLHRLTATITRSIYSFTKSYISLELRLWDSSHNMAPSQSSTGSSSTAVHSVLKPPCFWRQWRKCLQVIIAPASAVWLCVGASLSWLTWPLLPLAKSLLKYLSEKDTYFHFLLSGWIFRELHEYNYLNTPLFFS